MAFVPLLAGIGAAASSAAPFLTAGATLFGGLSSMGAANYRAQVADNNSQIATQNADYSIAAGLAKTDTAARRSAAVGGRLKAAQAANGIDVNSGSAVDVQESQRETGKLDSETVLNNAELEAYGYRSQATSFKAQAKLDRAEGISSLIGSGLKAGGGLLGSANSLGTKWSGPSGPDLEGGVWPA